MTITGIHQHLTCFIHSQCSCNYVTNRPTEQSTDHRWTNRSTDHHEWCSSVILSPALQCAEKGRGWVTDLQT